MKATTPTRRIKTAHRINDVLFNKFRFPGSRKLGRAISKALLPALVTPNGGKEIYNLGFYEVGTLNVMRKCLKPGDVFVDVGVSIGLMSVYASQLVGETGKVMSFEPEPGRYETLYSNINLNTAKNIQRFNMGLGARN